MVTPAARREAVDHLQSAFEVSERRACAVIGVDRTSFRHRSRRADDAAVRARLRELAGVRRRFGYRVLMRREGLTMNHKKIPPALSRGTAAGARCATPGAPRPAPLLHRAPWAQMSPRLYLSADESWGSGQLFDFDLQRSLTAFRIPGRLATLAYTVDLSVVSAFSAARSPLLKLSSVHM
jgi:hypothetical protein